MAALEVEEPISIPAVITQVISFLGQLSYYSTCKKEITFYSRKQEWLKNNDVLSFRFIIGAG
jgi:hypothetical protein